MAAIVSLALLAAVSESTFYNGLSSVSSLSEIVPTGLSNELATAERLGLAITHDEIWLQGV